MYSGVDAACVCVLVQDVQLFYSFTYRDDAAADSVARKRACPAARRPPVRAKAPFLSSARGVVTTNDLEPAQLADMLLGILASDLAWDAVLSSFSE